jgi:hypothetical protein
VGAWGWGGVGGVDLKMFTWKLEKEKEMKRGGDMISTAGAESRFSQKTSSCAPGHVGVK